MNTEITVKLERVNGVVDANATVASFVNAVDSLIAQEQETREMIAGAVDAVWSAHPSDTAILIDDLATLATAFISGMETSDVREIKATIKDYIRNTPSLFHVAKGAGGGVQLLARLDAEGLASVEASRAKAAAKRAAVAA
jgi:hypothetical protein